MQTVTPRVRKQGGVCWHWWQAGDRGDPGDRGDLSSRRSFALRYAERQGVSKVGGTTMERESELRKVMVKHHIPQCTGARLGRKEEKWGASSDYTSPISFEPRKNFLTL